MSIFSFLFMDSVHGHKVIDFIKSSTPPISKHNLENEIIAKFGDASFHTCSLVDLSAAQLISFLEQAGKLVVRNGISFIDANSVCDNE